MKFEQTESLSLSANERARIDELSTFYSHLNKAVLNMIDKFNILENVTSQSLKTVEPSKL